MSSQADLCCYVARISVIGGVLLFPWLPGQLMLYWLLPIARVRDGERDSVRTWMLYEEQNKLRLALFLMVPVSLAYSLWIIPLAMSNKATMHKEWEDCPAVKEWGWVVRNKVWVGCFGFLLGPVLADI
jgi:hypothetical protein